MKIACVVPPIHYAVNELGHGYQPPLGLLTIAGPLIEAGFHVELVDGDAAYLTNSEIISKLKTKGVDVVLVGHSGAMSANGHALRLITEIKSSLSGLITVYGGVYPTYSYDSIMSAHAALDFIIRGEGEATTLELIKALWRGERDYSAIDGLVWRSSGRVVVNARRRIIEELDSFRPAWNIADWNLYNGRHIKGRSAIVQFSRGCPHTCTYCGQWRFWSRWRHRSVKNFIDELESLHDLYGVRMVWLADENFGADQGIFRELLEALAARKLDIGIFCALRAEDVVRDKDFIHLYKEAGIVCLMLGTESLDKKVLQRIGKNNPFKVACEAVRLLKRNEILSVVNIIYGFKEETIGSLLTTTLMLRAMSPDFYNALHFTPLHWTTEGRKFDPGRIIQPNPDRWDYRQPVIRLNNFSPRTFSILVKISEMVFYFRPLWLLRAILRKNTRSGRIVLNAAPKLLRVYIREFMDIFSAERI